jgi:hypothetical protein
MKRAPTLNDDENLAARGESIVATPRAAFIRICG